MGILKKLKISFTRKRDGGLKNESGPPDWVLRHVAKILDYLRRSEAVSNEYFKCERLGEGHIYSSVGVVANWLQQFGYRAVIRPGILERIKFELKSEAPKILAFVCGVAITVAFFLPEIFYERPLRPHTGCTFGANKLAQKRGFDPFFADSSVSIC